MQVIHKAVSSTFYLLRLDSIRPRVLISLQLSYPIAAFTFFRGWSCFFKWFRAFCWNFPQSYKLCSCYLRNDALWHEIPGHIAFYLNCMSSDACSQHLSLLSQSLESDRKFSNKMKNVGRTFVFLKQALLTIISLLAANPATVICGAVVEAVFIEITDEIFCILLWTCSKGIVG